MPEISSNFAMVIFLGLVAFVIVACTAICLITDYLHKSRQSEIEAWLKLNMLERGMSAEDIRTVLEARTDGEAARLALVNDQFHLGLGKFHLKLGGKPESVSSAG
jgi:hypothetical protein